jgi:hypothetical protein
MYNMRESERLLMQKWICKYKGLIPEIDIQSVSVDLTY